MKITQPEKQVKPGEEEIESQNCCGQCLYNVPQGTFMMFLPGIMCLLIGIIMFFTNERHTWRKGLIKADVIFIALGTVLAGGGIIYCSLHYCRLRNRKPKSYPELEAPSMASSSTVQLVGVYRITSEEASPGFQPQTSTAASPYESRT